MRPLLTVAIAISLLMISPATSHADDCSADVAASHQELVAGMKCAEPGHETPGPAVSTSSATDPYDGYKWMPAVPACASITCQLEACDPPMVHMGLWGHLTNGSGWTLIRNQCVDPDLAAPPAITPGVVLNELRRVGLPALTVATDPGGKTLVNLDTIFYTDAAPVTRTLNLLGQSVLVEATPTTYVWHFGDGESATTDSPGAPYPAMDLTHRYARAGVTMHPSVDTTYTARFRVNGGAWQDVDGRVTIAGPPIDLRVAEATPVLSGNR